MRSPRVAAALPLALALGVALLAAPARAQEPGRARRPPTAPLQPATPVDALQSARAAFEYQDYALVERLLKPQAGKIENPGLRAEAFRLLGIALYYQNKSDDSAAAFLNLLELEPDEELDPFYVSPRAINFFEQVKKNNEERLRPIRERKRAEAEERRRAADAEAAARKKREQEEEARRLAALRPPILERRVVQREFWVSLLPFGIGQMQNGDQSLGTALATSQIIAGATSAGSALLIEALRDRSTGKFTDSAYPIASKLQVAKWIGAGVFYALWIGGAIHATVRYKPEVTPPDLVLPGAAQPGSAQPAPVPAPPPAAVPAPAPAQQPATLPSINPAFQPQPAPMPTAPAPAARP